MSEQTECRVLIEQHENFWRDDDPKLELVPELRIPDWLSKKDRASERPDESRFELAA